MSRILSVLGDRTKINTVRRRVGDSRWQRLGRALRVDRSPAQRPLPPVTVKIGPHLRGWHLRLLIGLIGLGCTALIGSAPFLWVISIALCLLMAIRPSGPVPVIFAVLAGLALLFIPPGPWQWRSYLLLFGLHLLVTLGPALANAAPGSLVELRVLTNLVPRFLIIQLGTQLCAFATAALSTQHYALTWLASVAMVILAAAAWLVLARTRKTLAQQPPSAPPTRAHYDDRRWGD